MIPKSKKDKNVKTFANAREKKLAKKLGAKLTPNSGSLTHFKGDLFTANELVDLKSTQKSQIVITVSMLQKLVDDAFTMGREPVLVLDFPNSDLVNKQWILFPKSSLEKK
jgi:hypothetical protein